MKVYLTSDLELPAYEAPQAATDRCSRGRGERSAGHEARHGRRGSRQRGGRASAQLVVVDPGNLVQTVLIAERTLREYDTLWAQYQTILRMTQKLGNMNRYRTPPIAISRHDPSRWPYGAAWLRTQQRRQPRSPVSSRRRDRWINLAHFSINCPLRHGEAVENAYATIEITDAMRDDRGPSSGPRARVYRAASAGRAGAGE